MKPDRNLTSPSPLTKAMTGVSDAEVEILKLLWQHSPLGSSAIIEGLGPMGWAPSTVKTLISRLVRKGALIQEGQERSYLYRPAFSREEYGAQAGKKLAGQLFDGLSGPMLAQFLAGASLDPEEIEELKRILEQKSAP